MSSSDRDQRLAAKLRENLKRRKAQAKARAISDDEASGAEGDTAPDPEIDDDPSTTEAKD